MSIDTPSQLHVRLGAPVSLQASVALPGCYAGLDRVVDYTWVARTPTVLPGYTVPQVPPLLLPPGTANAAELGLSALPLKHGLAYTFEVRGCMRSPYACGTAEASVVLSDPNPHPLTPSLILILSLSLSLTLSLTLTLILTPNQVVLIDEPLQAAIAGAYRRVGRNTAFTLCACATTYDPDSETAFCSAGVRTA